VSLTVFRLDYLQESTCHREVDHSPRQVTGDRYVSPVKNRVMGRCMFASAFFVLRGQINGEKAVFV